MLSYNDARQIGMQCCVDMLGRDFVKKYISTSSSAYGEDDGIVYCFLGISTEPDVLSEDMVLSSRNDFPYRASCSVNMETGEIRDKNLVRPAA